MNCLFELTLLFRRSAGNPAWHYFPLFGHELLEQFMVLEVNMSNAFQVPATFFFREETEALPVGSGIGRFSFF